MDAVFGITILILLCLSVLYLMFGLKYDEQASESESECEACDKVVCDGVCSHESKS